MPFWQHVQRCENCAFWQSADPSNGHGTCTGEWNSAKRPYWAEPREAITSWDDGQACAAYKHDKRKPHPLDDARAFISLAEVGDRLPMRTYSRGEPQRTTAEVVHRNSQFFTVRMLNAHYRLRLDATTTERAGTIMGMEEWGVDLGGLIERREARTEQPELAKAIIDAAVVGSTLHIVGYPPFNHVRKTAKVLIKTDKYLTIRIDRHRRKSKMHAAGPLAGIIEGEVWTLDTTGVTHHDEEPNLHAGTGDST